MSMYNLIITDGSGKRRLEGGYETAAEAHRKLNDIIGKSICLNPCLPYILVQGGFVLDDVQYINYFR